MLLLLFSVSNVLLLFTSIIYEKWLSEFTEKKHAEIKVTLINFIDSCDFRLSEKHKASSEEGLGESLVNSVYGFSGNTKTGLNIKDKFGKAK